MRALDLGLVTLLLAVGCGGLAERNLSEAPGACEDGATRGQSCGKNGRGELSQFCQAGTWHDVSCEDPDECTDGEVAPVPCAGGSGTTERSCVDGTWVNGDCAPAPTVPVIPVSLNPFGGPGAGDSFSPSISADGLLVAFHSFASDLVQLDTNDLADVFVRDLASGTTRCISLGMTGAPGNGNSFKPVISADGRFVVFYSDADNLVLGDTNGAQDVFLHELSSGLTRRFSIDGQGKPGEANSVTPSISGDGRFVVFQSLAGRLAPDDKPAPYDIFVHDTWNGTTRRAADGNSAAPDISQDGRVIAYSSISAKQIAGDANRRSDVFAYDVSTEQARIVSVNSTGEQANDDSFLPSLSADGRFVTYHSLASNLEGGDTNGKNDVFVHDRAKGTTRRISVSATGEQGNGESTDASISGDGRFVAFTSSASNLVDGDTNGVPDVFVRDLVTGAVRCVSRNGSGVPANDDSGGASITPDGAWIAFHSRASDLMSIDTNDGADVFVTRRE